MPKRAIPAAAVAPITALRPPPPPSLLIQRLRTDWRWAAISQFLWMFSDAFGFVDWDIENLEMDLDGDESQLLPDLLAKLLYALTYNRQINRDNSMEHLRKQYAKRAPDINILGTVDEPIDWATLGLGQKVQILWELCEWQLVDPARFRALLKGEDEAVAWRIDPIGWDKAGNTYFLFDDNRLWVQRLPPPPPPPPKKSTLKAKKSLKRSRPTAPPKQSHKKRQMTPPPTPTTSEAQQVGQTASGPRKRTQVAFYGNPTSTVEALKRGGRTSGTPAAPKSTRSSTWKAGPSTAQPTISSPVPSQSKAAAPPPRGTRMSRRARDAEDEWQQVPEEWLETKSNGKRKARAEDEESELSELTDEDEHDARVRASAVKTESVEMNGDGKGDNLAMDEDQLTPAPDEAEEEISELKGHESPVDIEEPTEAKEISDEVEEPDGAEDDTDDVKLAVKAAADLPADFVEWEAVSITLYDWRTFPQQFAKSRDPDEKTLFRTLTEVVGPTVIEALVVEEQERLKQEAIVHRKRSSRIATRELEREEQLRRENANREMEERMERSRRAEARAAREEAEFTSRERAREDRLKEREERAAAREDAILRQHLADEKAKIAREKRRLQREGESIKTGSDSEDDVQSNGKASGTITPKTTAAKATGGDKWELNCEVCRRTGWDLDHDADVVCCDDCGRWQHVECHDRQDAVEGRRKRNWDKVDFKCKECRRRAARQREPLHVNGNSSNHVNGNSSRAPPPTTSGQYYLPYPPPGQATPPAGYAVYYPSPHTQSVPLRPTPQVHHTGAQHVQPHHPPPGPSYPPHTAAPSSHPLPLQHTSDRPSEPQSRMAPAPMPCATPPDQAVHRPPPSTHRISSGSIPRPHIVQSAVPHSASHPFAPRPSPHDGRTAFGPTHHVSNGQPRPGYPPQYQQVSPLHEQQPPLHHRPSPRYGQPSPIHHSAYPPQPAHQPRPQQPSHPPQHHASFPPYIQHSPAPHQPQAHRSPLPNPATPSPHYSPAPRPSYPHQPPPMPHLPPHQSPHSHPAPPAYHSPHQPAQGHLRQRPPFQQGYMGPGGSAPPRPMPHVSLQYNGPG